MYKNSNTDHPPCVIDCALQIKETIFCCFLSFSNEGHSRPLKQNSKNML